MVESCKRMQLTADGKGAVFDVPSEHVQAFLEAAGACAGMAWGEVWCGWGWGSGAWGMHSFLQHV